MTVTTTLGPKPIGMPTGASLSTLAEILLALRSTADPGAAGAIAGACAVRALAAREHRLLRIDSESEALVCVEESGPETPYLPESDGPVARALRDRAASFDCGRGGLGVEAPLWSDPPAALATVPLIAGAGVFGVLLVAFDARDEFTADEQTFLRATADALALEFERLELRRTLTVERARAAALDKHVLDGEASLSHLMSLVAHEIRSPLTAIKAYAEALLDTLTHSNAPRDRFLGIINEECDRLVRLVADILDLSRLEAGRRPLRLARFDLEPLVAETLEASMTSAHSRQVSFDLDVERGLQIEADPDLVRRLFLDLLGVALHHSPRSGRVRIQARGGPVEWTGIVEDQGPSIPADDLPHLFERFYRGRPNADPESSGHGLGLAILRGIVEAHGGRAWAESLDPCGARLCFAMPLRQIASPRARRIARQIAGGSLARLHEPSIDLIAAAMDAQIVSLAMVDAEQGDLSIVASRGLEGFRLIGRRSTFRSGVTGSVAAWGKPLLVNNIETDRRFERQSNPQYRTKSLLCVPLRVCGEVLGVINVTNKNSGVAFDAADLAVLLQIADRIGHALERVWAHPESGRVVEEALASIRRMAASNRERNLGVRDRVHLAASVAAELGLDESDTALIAEVAALRESATVPAFRPGAQAEPESARRGVPRPGVNVDVLRSPDYMARVHELLLSEPERWDGAGHPRGLAGVAIPIGARILAAVQAYVTLRQGTLFQPPRSREEAGAELGPRVGSELDPQVVEALLRIVGKERTAA